MIRFIVLGLALLAIHGTAFGEVALRGQIADGKVSARATLIGKTATEISLFSVDKNAVVRSSVRKEPLDLWLLLDNSALCARNQATQTLSQWIGQLGSELPAASRVSLLTFRRGAFETLATQQPVGSLPVSKLRCETSSVSAEPERALAFVNDTDIPAGLSRAVWILSSGNLTASRSTLQRLKESGSHVSIFLYNPVVFPALAPVFDSLRQSLGEELFLAQAVTAGAPLPSRTVRLEADVPAGISGTGLFQIKAKQGDQSVASNVSSVRLPPARQASQLERTLFWIAVCLGVGLLAYAGLRITRFYRTKYCGQCGNRQRHADAVCGFCFAPEGAYLAVQNPLGGETPTGSPLLAPLHATRTAIGTHRKSALRCLRAVRERRKIFFHVEKQDSAYQLVPGAVAVFLNGMPVQTPRYLAAGDQILAHGAQFRFVQNRRSAERD